jgi:hypothetical protein
MPCGAGYEDKTKMQRNVCFWHLTDAPSARLNVRYEGKADVLRKCRDVA